MAGINTYRNYYFVGIGGIGMSALARYFKSIGKRVVGYDKTKRKFTDELEAEGFKINFEDRLSELETTLTPQDTLVIYTPAIHELSILDDFKNRGFEVIKRAHALGMITENSECIAVAGTHGKTTTTTLIAHLCKVADLPFSGFLGGISENYQSNFIYNGHKFSVVEADEYDRSFLQLKPDWAVVTYMDPDHLDIYGDGAHVVEAYKEFASMVKDHERLFIRKGLPIGEQAMTYAVNKKADFYSDHIEIKGDILYFDFHFKEEPAQRFEWKLLATHNVENATVALAIVRQLGASYDDLKKGIRLFKGIKRRYTKHFFENGKIYIDDYAHHPTELNTVISSIKDFYPDKKLLIAFQPHLFTRTQDFADDFAKVLSRADELLLLDIYPARELPIPGVTSDWLCSKVDLDKKEVCSLAQALDKIKQKEFDILLTVGAGDIDTLYDPLMQWFGREKEF